MSNRTTEATINQMSVVLASAAEWQLATVECLAMRKSSTKSDKERHQSMADQLVRHCWELGVDPHGLRGIRCGRLAVAMARLEAAS